MTPDEFIDEAVVRLVEATNRDPESFVSAREAIMTSATIELGEGVDVHEISDAIPDNVDQLRRLMTDSRAVRVISIPGIRMEFRPEG
jgi:hypothetical protein